MRQLCFGGQSLTLACATARRSWFGPRRRLNFERLTIMCCANMSGTHKKKLLAIGNSLQPQCFKNQDLTKFLVDYKANKNAWMTSVFFEEWLRKWDTHIRKGKKNKIVLFVDQCAAHTIPKGLKFIRVEFLLANTTCILQPMDQGVIANLKQNYRKQTCRLTLQRIDNEMLPPTANAKTVSSTINLLDAIQMI